MSHATGSVHACTLFTKHRRLRTDPGQGDSYAGSMSRLRCGRLHSCRHAGRPPRALREGSLPSSVGARAPMQIFPSPVGERDAFSSPPLVRCPAPGGLTDSGSPTRAKQQLRQLHPEPHSFTPAGALLQPSRPVMSSCRAGCMGLTPLRRRLHFCNCGGGDHRAEPHEAGDESQGRQACAGAGAGSARLSAQGCARARPGPT